MKTNQSYNPYARLHYYDLKRHWSKKVLPHLHDKTLNDILVKDFNKYTSGRWKKKFILGQLPHEFETGDWWLDHKGPKPRFWWYTKSEACHWLVNFNLKLASLVSPNQKWQIITSDLHSTVLNGADTLFDFNFLAFGIPPAECFDLAVQGANAKTLPPGKFRKVYYAEDWDKEPRWFSEERFSV
jgi:hypothetical protein